MPPLQYSALRLSDASKTRLEVFFHFILFLFLFIYFYNGLGFTDTQGFHPSEVWASFIPMLYITALPSKRSFGCNFFFFFSFFTMDFHLHGPDHTQGTSSLECKPTLVLLGKSVSQLSCSASMSFL